MIVYAAWDHVVVLRLWEYLGMREAVRTREAIRDQGNCKLSGEFEVVRLSVGTIV